MTKYLCLSIALLATLFSFAQTDITGKIKTESLANHELSYALRPENTKRKPLIIFLHGSGEKGTDIEKVKYMVLLNI
jgi:predicted peptidase